LFLLICKDILVFDVFILSIVIFLSVTIFIFDLGEVLVSSSEYDLYVAFNFLFLLLLDFFFPRHFKINI